MLVAIMLIAFGLLLSLGALFAMDFDFTKMNTINFTTNTYSIDQAFTSISVEGAECDIRLLISENDTCKVVCTESDKISHSVTVKDNTLTISRSDTRRWYEHIGIYWGSMEIEIYLPQTEYESLYALSLSGNIEIPRDFSFSEAEIHNTSGNVNFSAAVKNDLSINTVSGDITLADITCQNIAAKSTSGSVVFSNVVTSGNTHIETVSGNTILQRCDADSIWIKTTSGDILGTLLTEKIFLTDTTSGAIDVPQSTSGGNCEIKTTSGDITFSIE